MLKKFVAVIKEQRIISVRAETEKEAKAIVRDQLNRPGRYQTLFQWSMTGEQIIEEVE